MNGKAHRINAYLAGTGSPLEGHGYDFAMAEVRTGVNAELLVGLTMAESSLATDGSLSRSQCNAWGMKGPQPQLGIMADGGWCAWRSWEEAIQGAADFVLHYWGPAQSAHELRGYCEGTPTYWIYSVEGCRKAI